MHLVSRSCPVFSVKHDFSVSPYLYLNQFRIIKNSTGKDLRFNRNTREKLEVSKENLSGKSPAPPYPKSAPIKFTKQ